MTAILTLGQTAIDAHYLVGKDAIAASSINVSEGNRESLDLVLLTHVSSAQGSVLSRFLQSSHPKIKPDTVFVSFLNDSDTENLIQAFPNHLILGGLCYLGAQVIHRPNSDRLASRILHSSTILKSFKAHDRQALENRIGWRFDPVFNLQNLTQEQRDYFSQLRSDLFAKRKEGLKQYQQEIGSSIDLKTQTEEELYQTFVSLRKEEFKKDKIKLQVYKLNGIYDGFSQDVPIHVEVFCSQNSKSRAVVHIVPGYGETTVMYNDIIKRFVNKGYTVVIADQRGHGFSGYPLGVPGYMDSAENMIYDSGVVLNFIQQKWPNLPVQGFAFSQGGLWLTRLAQMYPSLYSQLSLVSPTIHLGRRFRFIFPEVRLQDQKAYDDYMRLDIERINFIPMVLANKRFGQTPQRLEAQKWLDRGFLPSHFIIQDGSVVWDKAIEDCKQFANQNGPVPVPYQLFIGENDGHTGGYVVGDAAQKFFGTHGDIVKFPGQDHQLLLEPQSLAPIINQSLSFLTSSLPLIRP